MSSGHQALWLGNPIVSGGTVEFASFFGPEFQNNPELKKHQQLPVTNQVLDDPLDENLYLIFEGLPGGQLMNWNEQSCSYSAGPAVERSLASYHFVASHRLGGFNICSWGTGCFQGASKPPGWGVLSLTAGL